MKRALTIQTTNELAYIDGQILHDDVIEVAHDIMGPNNSCRLSLCSSPIPQAIKAQKIGEVGVVEGRQNSGCTQYTSKRGIFTVCNKSVTKYELGNHFYFKITR